MTKLGLLCDRILEAGWLTAAIAVPFYFNIYSSRVFEPDKIILLRCIVLLMALAFVVKTAEYGLETQAPSDESGNLALSRLKKLHASNPLALPAALFAAIYVLTTLTSISPDISFWGSYQRLQGTYSLLTYITLFFLVAHNLRTKAQWDRLITVFLLASVPISVYGLMQRFHLDPLPWGGDVTERIASTMGNAIFLGAYLIMVVPIVLAKLFDCTNRLRTMDRKSSSDDLFLILGFGVLVAFQNLIFVLFLLKSKDSPNLWWGMPALIGILLVTSILFSMSRTSYMFVLARALGCAFLLAIHLTAIFLTSSRGPWIGLGAGLFFFIIVLSMRLKSQGLLTASSTLAGLTVAFLLLMNAPNTPLAPLKSIPYVGRLGELAETEKGTGRVRVLIWQGATQLVTQHPIIGFGGDVLNILRPLIGYGPEAMYVAYNKVYPPDLAHYEARNASPDRSHMDLLDALVMTGLFGWLASLFVFFSGMKEGWRRLQSTSDFSYLAMTTGLMSGIVAHFVESQVGISIASSLTYLWLFLGLIVALRVVQMGQASYREAALEPARAIAAPKPVSAARERKPALAAGARHGRRNPSLPDKPSKGTPSRSYDAKHKQYPFLVLYLFSTALGLFVLSSSPQFQDVHWAYAGGVLWLLGGIVVAGFGLGRLPAPRVWHAGNWWIYLPLAVVAGLAIQLNLNTVSADIYYKRGFSFDAQRQWDQSIPAYQQALRLAPGQDFYYLFLGRTFLELSKLSSKPPLKPAPPINVELVNNISLQDINRFGKEDLLNLSYVALERARELAPLNTDHYANLGRLFRYWADAIDRQLLDRSSTYYELATRLSPQAAHLWDEWAEVYMAKGLPAEALEKAKKAVDLDKEYPQSFVFLGDAYLALGKPAEAVEAHRRALAIDPIILSDARLEYRVNVYLQSGQAEALATAYAGAVQRAPKFPAVVSAYGYLLSRIGKTKEALEQFKAWVALAPTDWLAHRNLAVAYDVLGMGDDALRAAQEAKKLAPADQQQPMQNWITELEKRRP
ncbi:MAG: O-antigen ligase family protein [Chloroflexi bacterium]|nr:O-antigen ligase family protein [Chloroflexota bacterium]